MIKKKKSYSQEQLDWRSNGWRWHEQLLIFTLHELRVTSCVSLVKVTGLFSLFGRMICTNWLLGTSFIMCHLI